MRKTIRYNKNRKTKNRRGGTLSRSTKSLFQSVKSIAQGIVSNGAQQTFKPSTLSRKIDRVISGKSPKKTQPLVIHR
jgi:hypothetical protein